MAIQTDGPKLSEAERNAPDLDDDGNLDVEHYLVPDGDHIKDDYLRSVWEEVSRQLNGQEELDGPAPERNQAAADADRIIYAAAYHGEGQQPTFAPLGPEDAVSRFVAWCRTQDRYPEVQQVAIDGSTNPAGNRDDVQRYAAELGAALDRLADEGAGAELKGIGRTVLAACAGAEGIVLTEQGAVK